MAETVRRILDMTSCDYKTWRFPKFSCFQALKRLHNAYQEPVDVRLLFGLLISFDSAFPHDERVESDAVPTAQAGAGVPTKFCSKKVFRFPILGSEIGRPDARVVWISPFFGRIECVRTSEIP
eukprot:656547-Amorphochlora_amoeboformis.AAC.2